MSSSQISQMEGANLQKQRHIYKIFDVLDTQLLKVMRKFLDDQKDHYNFANNTKFTPISLYEDIYIVCYIKTIQPEIKGKSTNEINKTMKDCYEKLSIATQRSVATIKDRINKKLWKVNKEQFLNSIIFKKNLKFDKKSGENQASKKSSKQKTAKSSSKKIINENFISLDSSDEYVENINQEKHNQTPASTKPVSQNNQFKNRSISKPIEENRIIQQQQQQDNIRHSDLPQPQVLATITVNENKQFNLFQSIDHGLFCNYNEQTLDDIIFICIDNNIACYSKKSVQKQSENSLEEVRILIQQKKEQEQRQKRQKQQRQERQRKQKQQRQQRQRKQRQRKKQEQKLLNRQKIAENLQRYEDKFESKFKQSQPMEIEAPQNSNSSSHKKTRNIFPIQKVPTTHQDEFMKMFQQRKQQKNMKNLQQDSNKSQNIRQQTLHQLNSNKKYDNQNEQQKISNSKIVPVQSNFDQRNKEWEKIRESADLRDALRRKQQIGKFRRSSQFVYKRAFDHIRSDQFLKQNNQQEQENKYKIKPVLYLNREEAENISNKKPQEQSSKKIITIDDQSADMQFEVQKPSTKKTVSKFKKINRKNFLSESKNYQFIRKQNNNDDDDMGENLIGLRPSPANQIQNLPLESSILCKQQQDVLKQSVKDWNKVQVILKLLIRHNPDLRRQKLQNEYKILGLSPPKSLQKLYL